MKAMTILLPTTTPTNWLRGHWLWLVFCVLLVLRSVSAQTNYTPYTFTTLSGLSSAGFKDDTNNNSRFTDPCGIAIDASGNLYVADCVNSSIRMISHSGTNWVVTTIAGTGASGTNDGLGSVAQFDEPEGITVGPNGVIYVADTLNDTIRSVTPSGSNWIVSTLAGSPGHAGTQNGTNNGALFFTPTGLAVDSSTNIYVADENNNAIRKVTPSGSNWVVSTYAGFLGQFPPGGTNDGPGGIAQFSSPGGIVLASSGNLFVADSGNAVIRMITPADVVSTPIGTARVYGSMDGTNKAASFMSPIYGITADNSGNLYVADYNNETIRKITPAGTNWVVTTIAGLTNYAGSQDGTNHAALFCNPFSLAIDASGNLYVSDSRNNSIRELSLTGTNWVSTTIAGLPGSTGSADGALSAAKYNFPGGIAVDGFGNTYVADSGNNTIRMITTSGVSRTIAGTPQVKGSADGTNGAASFYNPSGLAIDSATNIYVADMRNDTIRKISPIGTNWVVTTLAGLAGHFGSTDGTNTNARFNFPIAVALDSSNNIYVGDSRNGEVREISHSGTNWVTTTLTNSGKLYSPEGIAVDPQGDVFVCDFDLSSVYKLVWSGSNWATTLLFGPGTLNTYGAEDGAGTAVRFNSPESIALDPSGNIYIADTYNCTIRRATLTGTNWQVTTLGGIGGGPPTNLGTVGGADGTGTNAEFYRPLAVAVDAYGTVYVADNYNNTIRKGWAAGTPPIIVLGAPTMASGKVQFGFRLASGTATTFELLQADQLTGPWTTNSSAILTTNVPGISFNAAVPVGGASEFYRIQTP